MSESEGKPKPEIKRLTARERKFFLAYIDGASLGQAYLVIKPDVTYESSRVLGSKMMRKIKAKIDWELLLEEAGLGEERLLQEINSRLNARTTQFYEGKPVADLTDNFTRQRATELLADLLGRRKNDVTVHHDVVEIIPAPKPDELGANDD